MTREKRYTLDEARVELRRQECLIEGHDYDVMRIYGRNEPAFVRCTRCGMSWDVNTEVFTDPLGVTA
jgi:hypothetical protein